MPRALLGLGANQGDCVAQLSAALESLAIEGTAEIGRSQWRQTAPVGGPTDQPPYWNGAALLDTDLTPQQLWRRMERLEHEAGRLRVEHWGPRTLDLDLLLYDDWIVNDDLLTIPHPRLALRHFVLDPAAEIAPTMWHPVLGRTIGELAAHLAATAPIVAIVGEDEAVSERLKGEISRLVDAKCSMEERWRVVTSRCDAVRLGAGDSALTPPPRLLIVASDLDSRLDPLMWPADVRERIGPIAFVDPSDTLRAAEDVLIAMQGLSATKRS